jgi:anaerobic magnesium-protoporphyrin IX monomethyl ester cyclase
MALRIRFIEPAPPGPHVYDHVLLPRLGTPLMGALLADAGHDVRCYCEMISPVDIADCLSADLVGISSITSTQPAAYQLAAELAAAGVPVVLGGPHVTFMAEEGLDHASYVVRGEGQATITDLAAALDTEHPLSGIAGLSWRDGAGQRHHNPDRTRCSQREFQALPAPDLSLIADSKRMPIKPVMTRWGCPFDCDFCAVTATFSRRVRYRRNSDVLAELAALDARRVFFHDDNFVVSKARTADLLRSVAATGLTPDWFAQVRAETVYRPGPAREPDHDFLALMKSAGCQMVMVGFESTCDETLRQMNKKLEVRDIVDSVRLFHEHGILVHGMFVAGADTDPAAQADRIADFARHHGIDTIQIMIETPLPGTHLYERAQAADRILTADWSFFDGHHAVMRPARRTRSGDQPVPSAGQARRTPPLARAAPVPADRPAAPGLGTAADRFRRARGARLRPTTDHEMAGARPVPALPGLPRSAGVNQSGKETTCRATNVTGHGLCEPEPRWRSSHRNWTPRFSSGSPSVRPGRDTASCTSTWPARHGRGASPARRAPCAPGSGRSCCDPDLMAWSPRLSLAAAMPRGNPRRSTWPWRRTWPSPVYLSSSTDPLPGGRDITEGRCCALPAHQLPHSQLRK